MLRTENKIIATDLEFANTPIRKVLGLMFRKSIDQDYALIFSLSNPRIVSVHMHFVKFPIDVLLLDENKNIIQMDTLEASKGKLKSKLKVQYAIEMQAGTIKKHRLEIGNQLFF